MARGPRVVGRRAFARFASIIRSCLAAFSLAVASSSALAVEQAEEFIAGLYERGLTDLVPDYLDRIESSRLIDDRFKQRIPYHRGVVLLEQSRSASSAEERTRLIDQARQQIDAYAQANAGHPDAAEARGRLGGAVVDEARRNIARAEQLPEGSPQRQSLLVSARQLIEQARGQIQLAEEFYSDELAKIPKTLDPRTEAQLIEKRQLYRGRLAQARLLVAQSDYEKAQAYPADSQEYRQLNTSAARSLGELFEQYSRWLVGFYANLYEGRCYQALGEYQKALGCFDNVISQPDDDPAFRRLITSGYRYQAECLTAQQQYDTAIANCEGWLKQARGTEENEPEWLALRYRLADAYRAKAEALGDKTAAYRNLTGEAREAYQFVARQPGEFQQQARLAAAELGRGGSSDSDPKTFAAAYDAGRAALDELNQANVDLEIARQNGESEQVSELESQAASAQSEALRMFTLALSLADDEVETSKLNELRYFCCWLHYQTEEYYRAAILGEFIARRYADHQAASAAAKLAMAAYERLYNQAVAAGENKDQTEFEASHLAAMAEFITRRWPGSDDAEAALAVLMNFALRHDRLEEARQLLDDVAEDRRPQMEMKLGTALWAKYVEVSQTTSDAGDVDPTAIRDQAMEFLQSGLDAVRETGNVSQTAAAATLYLTQALLSEGKYQEAVALLEDPEIGPLSLVESDHPIAANEEFTVGAYKAALQAYVSVEPPQGETAVEIMNRLEKSVGNDANAAERLTKTYIGLGLELERQVGELKAAGRESEAERVSAAFAEFLDRVAVRQQGAGWAARSWIAQSYYSLGTGLGRQSTQGREYFERAADTYEQLIAATEEDPHLAPSPLALLAANKQLGLALQKSGDYQRALGIFSSILGDKVTRLDVQKAAAYTCQFWGEEGDPKWLERAVTGGLRQRSDGKNRVWGWAHIAQVVSRYKDTNPQHRATFFEAWLNTARCRYLIAMKSDGTERQQNLARAEMTVRTMVRQYPDLGGDPWRNEYDKLARQIQVAQGETPVGLEEFKTAAQRQAARR